jgi:hypothetical protein
VTGLSSIIPNIGDVMYVNIEKTIEIRDSLGRLCGTYHYEDPFKSFFRGLYTPGGKDVVAYPPPDHPHHKGLQFGLCCSDVNFWEEDEAAEPPYRKLPIGRQLTTKLERLPPAVGNGFSQEVRWARDNVITFHETRRISVTAAPKAYVWTWQTTLIAARNVDVIRSAWNGPGYCGLGLRLARDLFQGGKVLPPGIGSGAIPPSVSFQGKGVEVTFKQDVKQKNALFVSTYEADPYFAFLSLGPTNLDPRHLNQGERLEGTYSVTVADSF